MLLKNYIALALTLFSLLCSLAATAEQVHIAVAANFTQAMKQIVEQFEQTTQHKVIVSFASSGKIFAQIQHGAPYDLFLSADTHKPEVLEQAGLTVTGTRFTYAIGGLALWSPQPDYIAIDGKSTLQSNKFQHIALANPKLAPYGQAAIETLKHLGLADQLSNKFVQGENINQTYQFIASGNAELGFVALSQILQAGNLKSGSAWIVPAELHATIKQDAVLIKRAENNPAAIAMLNFLKSDASKQIIEQFGYRR